MIDQYEFEYDRLLSYGSHGTSQRRLSSRIYHRQHIVSRHIVVLHMYASKHVKITYYTILISLALQAYDFDWKCEIRLNLCACKI